MLRAPVAVAGLVALTLPLAASAGATASATGSPVSAVASPPAAVAAAGGAGTTTLVDRPSGTGPAPSDKVNSSTASSGEAVSGNGRYVVFQSESDGLLPAGADPSITRVYVRDRVANTTTLVSTSTAGVPANNLAYSPVISDDGDRVAFVSTASNLVTGVSGTNVYVKDLSSGSTTLVSRRTGVNGTPNSGFLGDPTINSDGTRVAWWTYTSLDALDTNSVTDIYLRDLSTDTTTLMSLNTNGQVGTVDSRHPSIAGNGALVAFESGSALVPSDANGQTDVYVRSGATTGLVSQNAAGSGPGNGASYGVSVADDGLTVAFGSEATNLVGAGLDTNAQPDVFVRDLGTDTTLLVSRPDGSAAGQLTGFSYGAAISGSGDRVGFTSGSGNTSVAYVRTVSTNATALISRATGATGAPAVGAAYSVSLGTSGAAAVFVGEFPILGPDRDSPQVYVRDGATTALVSRPTGVAPPAAGAGSAYAQDGISDDGRFAVFVSSADGLTTNDDDVEQTAYLRDLRTNRLRNLAPGANAGTEVARISADGRTAAFVTFATNVGVGPGIYAYDVATGRLELVSRRDGAAGSPLPPDEYSYGISGNGRRIAFTTNVAIDAAKDTNGTTDIYVRDLDKHTTRLVSRINGAGTLAGNASAYEPSLDRTGNRIAYSTSATNLGDGDTTAIGDIHLRDLTANTTVLVSRPTAAPVPGDAGSSQPSISGDGRRVAFASGADNLAGSSSYEQVFLRDLAAGTTRLASRAGAAGAIGDSSSGNPDLSTDGSTIAFETSSDNLGAGGPVETAIVVRTLATGANVVASRANGASGALATRAYSASLTGNGSCVLFGANARGFGAYPSPDFNHVYLRTLKGACPDVTRPTITKAKLKPKSFTVKKGTKVKLRLSEAATLTLKVGKRTLVKKGKAGKNTIRFKGKFGKKVLKPGRYKLVVQAKDPAGNASKKVKLRFTVL